MSHDDAYWRRAHPENVVLDIGDDVGALVLYTPSRYRGQEIEISPGGDESRRTHTAVLERSAGGKTFLAAVYPELRAGRWRLRAGDPDLQTEVIITGGEVAEVDWR